MKKFYKKVIVTVLMTGMLAFTLTACGSEQNQDGKDASGQGAAGLEALEQAAEEKGALLGEFTTVTLEGEEVNQDIFAQSELTMLNIWGTFCGPCIQEMPELGELAEEYEGKMQIIGLIADVAEAENEAAMEIVEYTGADYMHIVNSMDLQAGYLGQVQAVPTTVFLDKEGKMIGEEYLGARSKDDWKKIIEEVMESME